MLKRARHAIFDEAHYSADNRPPYAKQLMELAEEHLADPTKPLPPPSLPVHLIPNDTHKPKTAQPQTDAPIVHLPSSPIPTTPPNHPPEPTSTPFTPLPITADDGPHIIMHTTGLPDDFHLSTNPFGPSTDFTLPLKGQHPTLGLDLIKHPDNSRILMKSCSPSTPAARIPRWRSTLRNSIIIAVNNTPIDSSHQVAAIIAKARAAKVPSVSFTVVPQEHIDVTPDTNIPQIHFDQLNVMAHQHHAAKHNTPAWSDPHNPPPTDDAAVFAAMDRGHIKPRLTRAFLKRQADWMDWALSEFKQLNQYHAQGMFGDPVRRPPASNVLPLIWTYLIKPDGTKKARCVCNGAPSRRGSVTLAHTYAAALDQSGARTFWAISALHNYKAYGADATNAFAEAPPPTAPLYVTIDEPFKAWWVQVLKRPPITVGHVLPVRHALQGHPESPRLWATMIHSILTGPSLNFTCATHEPCLYTGTFEGLPVYLLRQVDDFAVSSASEKVANAIFAKIQAGLKQPLKILGLLSMFNGIDVVQTQRFIKLSCRTYI